MQKIFKRPIIFGMIVIFISTVILFSVSVSMRSDQFGKLNLEHHNHLTGSTILFATHWYNDNPFSLGFKMYYLGKSIESPTPDKRFVYDTYPPGTIIPIYLISVLTQTPPSPKTVMGYNLFAQFWIAFLLAVALFLTLRRIRFNYVCSILASFATAAIMLFMPENMYFMQTVFFSDQAILLPFAALIFLEAARDLVYPNKFKRTIDTMQWILIFCGIFTDWLFIFVCFVLFVKRLINGQLGNKFKEIIQNTFWLALPALVAITIYVLQLLTNSTTRFIGVLIQRTGMDPKDGWVQWFDRMVWGQYLKSGYGDWANPIIWASFYVTVGLLLYFLFVLFIRSRETRDLKANTKTKQQIEATEIKKPTYINDNLLIVTNFLMLIVFPCFLQLYTFKNHSAIHDFSILKLSFILAACWVMLPITLYITIRDIIKLGNKTVLNTIIACLITAVVLVSAGGYLYYVTPTYKALYPPATPEMESYGTFIKNNTNYNDVLFSPDYSIASDQHQKLCLALKPIRKVEALSQITGTAATLPANTSVAVFIANKNKIPEWLSPFINNATLFKEEHNMQIYKIPKQKFMALDLR